jgi:hypothetical protein
MRSGDLSFRSILDWGRAHSEVKFILVTVEVDLLFQISVLIYKFELEQSEPTQTLAAAWHVAAATSD